MKTKLLFLPFLAFLTNQASFASYYEDDCSNCESTAVLGLMRLTGTYDSQKVSVDFEQNLEGATKTLTASYSSSNQSNGSGDQRGHKKQKYLSAKSRVTHPVTTKDMDFISTEVSQDEIVDATKAPILSGNVPAAEIVHKRPAAPKTLNTSKRQKTNAKQPKKDDKTELMQKNFRNKGDKNFEVSFIVDPSHNNICRAVDLYNSSLHVYNEIISSSKRIGYLEVVNPGRRYAKLWNETDNKYLISIITMVFVEKNCPQLFQDRSKVFPLNEVQLVDDRKSKNFNSYIVRKFWWQLLDNDVKEEYRKLEAIRIEKLKSRKNPKKFVSDQFYSLDPDFPQYVWSASAFGRAVKIVISREIRKIKKSIKTITN